MVDIIGGIAKAFQLIITGDPTLYGVVFRTLTFSSAAVILAALWGTPIAMLISLKNFRGKTVIKGFFNSLIGIPTVVLGLVLFLIFSHGGPLGFLGLLYTPAAIILGEAILVTPILISILINAIEAVDPDILNLAKTLGASESQASIAVLKEALNGVLLSNIASFNRAIAELGIALLVGGNIAGYTDVLTTAISRYTARGELDLAIALGIMLMAIVFLINMAVITLRKAKWLPALWRSPQA
ncbi:MAG: ABC transporter permease [Candidatus Bathyarchaeia archaeon]